MKISIIIPVYNSNSLSIKVVEDLEKVFIDLKYDYEIILVEDGSDDNSWNNIKLVAEKNNKIVAIKFLKNYGQHNAVICGFRFATGDYCITMDDDLQNPPEEIIKLIDHAIKNESDLVFGEYIRKHTSFIRNIGSKFVGYVVKKIFTTKKSVVNSNFRLIRKDVVKRIIEFKVGEPYINGLALIYSKNPTNVLVKHLPRHDGTSSYTISKIFSLLSAILFNYSSLPLRFVTFVGMIFSLIGFVMGFYFLIDKFINQGTYSGWASMFVLLCFFSGINLLILGILGEYIIKIVNQTKMTEQYIIDEKINTP